MNGLIGLEAAVVIVVVIAVLVGIGYNFYTRPDYSEHGFTMTAEELEEIARRQRRGVGET